MPKNSALTWSSAGITSTDPRWPNSIRESRCWPRCSPTSPTSRVGLHWRPGGEITHRAQIGLLVTGMGYRNPDLLADMARTADHISGGRLVLGLGAGWYEKDYTTYGYEFGTWKTRFDLFEAGLERITARFDKLIPTPVRTIPILIGGTGPKRTLPLVVRYADIWHTFLSVEGFTEATARLDEMAAAAGRDGNDIERSVHWFGVDSAEDYRAAGATIFVHEIAPDPATGYDFTTLEEMLTWRDHHNGG